MAIKRLPSTGDIPRSTGVPETLVPGGGADSAGFPWAGRTFDHHGTAFAADDGGAPDGYADAVTAVRSAAILSSAHGRGEWIVRLAAAHAAAILALSECRVLVPLLAEAGDTGVTPDGRIVEKSQELSIVTIAAADGRRAMPVFSSVATMHDWHPGARPIPVPGPQAALAAAQEETDLIIVDPGTPGREFGVRRTQLRALALGERILPPWADPEVLAAFRISAVDDPRVRSIELEPGDPESRLLAPETGVMLRLRPGLDRSALQALIGELQRRWAADEVIAERVDSLRLSLH